ARIGPPGEVPPAPPPAEVRQASAAPARPEERPAPPADAVPRESEDHPVRVSQPAPQRAAAKARPGLTVRTAGPVRVRAGGVTTFPVTVRREGFDESVTLRFEGLPPDVGIDGGADLIVPAGRGEVTVTLHAGEKAHSGDVQLTLTGTS